MKIQFFAKWLLISLLLGAIIGSASALFLITLETVTHLRLNNPYLVWGLPFAGGILGYLYYKWGKSVEAGNNLIIDAIHDSSIQIPFKMAPMVYLATLVSHLFGGSTGREGTALQMAGGLSSLLLKPFKLEGTERSMLWIAAVAGGFGSVFGTPIAGTLFALEFYRIGRIRHIGLLPAFFTAFMADYVCTLWGAHHTHYAVDFVPEFGPLGFAISIVVGIACGLTARSFSKGLRKVSSTFKQTIAYPPLRPFVGGVLLVGLYSLINAETYMGLGIPTIVASFHEAMPWYVFLFKMLFTILTLASGFKGGEVTPLFFIGATLGSALSVFLPLPLGLLTAMGFIAVFAGATNAPVACLFLSVEIFGSESLLYVGIACFVSYIVSGKTSIYMSQRIGDAKTLGDAGLEGKKLSDL